MKSPRLTRDGLVSSYFSSGRPRGTWLVGAEFERHLLRPDGMPLPYPGEPGVRWLMERLQANGWSPYHEDGTLIALARGQTNVTLEPGGQFELSGAPFRTVGEVEAEARAFVLEVDELLAGTGIRQIALGFTPFAAIRDVGWVPKGRYAVMREYLAGTGALAHHMMKGTAAVQATFDYADEQDCARKVRLATLLGPLTTGTFANSPYAEGEVTGYASWRGHIWTATDPARTGFPAAADNFSFERWVDWLLQVPMMFHREPGGQWKPARGRTFADWMGDEHGPGEEAWELHLTSVFPEVRIKRTIEIRGADCVALPLAMAFTALWKGLLYDNRALDRATEVAERFVAHGSQRDRFEIACRDGLEGVIGGRRMTEWAAEITDLARDGLEPAERPALEPLVRRIETGMSPGRTLLSKLGEHPGPAAILETAGMLG